MMVGPTGSLARGTNGLKKQFDCYRKIKKNCDRRKNEKNEKVFLKVSSPNNQNSSDPKNDLDNSGSSSNMKNSANQMNNINKEVPSLSQDSGGGAPNTNFSNKQPLVTPSFSFFSKNNIFSNSPSSLTHKEKQKACSRAYFKRKFKGND